MFKFFFPCDFIHSFMSLGLAFTFMSLFAPWRLASCQCFCIFKRALTTNRTLIHKKVHYEDDKEKADLWSAQEHTAG